ncbi:hypothetical protein V7796_20780 [Rhizobium laguerreae]|nr:hypothetical protein [Rhizobium leguminosarum]
MNRTNGGRAMPSFLEITPDKLNRIIGTPGVFAGCLSFELHP